VELGVVVGGDLTGIGDLARRAEDAGYESLWVAETARSAFVQAAVAGAATERVTVGTAIALAFPRSPAIAAMAARDLSELTAGRFVLGLGSQVKRVNEHRFGVPFEHPAPKMREYVLAARAVLGSFGGAVQPFEGEFYRITMAPFPGAGPAPGPVPIYLAAVNERMCEVAGEVADGVHGHPLNSPRYLAEVVRPAVARGSARAGREPADVSITTNVIVQLSADREAARREAAMQLAFYATTRTYAPVLAFHGHEERIGPLRRAFVEEDWERMAELALPMVDDLAIAGDADECRERLAAYSGAADRVVLGGAWVGPSPDRVADNYRRILETLGPAS